MKRSEQSSPVKVVGTISIAMAQIQDTLTTSLSCWCNKKINIYISDVPEDFSRVAHALHTQARLFLSSAESSEKILSKMSWLSVLTMFSVIVVRRTFLSCTTEGQLSSRCSQLFQGPSEATSKDFEALISKCSRIWSRLLAQLRLRRYCSHIDFDYVSVWNLETAIHRIGTPPLVYVWPMITVHVHIYRRFVCVTNSQCRFYVVSIYSTPWYLLRKPSKASLLTSERVKTKPSSDSLI